MKNSMAVAWQGLAASLAACLIAVPASSQEIRIIAKDGSFDMTGTLVSAENQQLKISTVLGELTLDQSTVICEGALCPKGREFVFDFSMAAPGDVAELLVPILFYGFATDRDADAIMLDEMGFPIEEDAVAEVIRAGIRVPLQILDFEGEEVALFGVQAASATQSFDLLAAGDVAVAFTDVAATLLDIQKVGAAGGGDLQSFEQEHLVAVDGLAVISNPQNPLAQISVPDVAAILAGRITDWSQVGGPAAPISLYSFAAGSDALRDVESLVLGPLSYQLSGAANIVGTPQELAAAVSQDPFGFGVLAYRNKRDNWAIPLANECGMVVPASPFTIKTAEYPLEKRVVAYSRADAAGYAREFLDELDNARFDGLVAKAGFIDLTIVPEGADYARARIDSALSALLGPGEQSFSDSMISEMGAAQRLSTAFRFAGGSSILDNRARRDLARMAAFIGENKPGKVYVVGYADSAGSFGQNQRLSQLRAQQVADQLAAVAAAGDALSGVTVEVRGYSELSPVACNETFEGRAINRRVEIWVQ